jgi:hypothetical protein
MKTFGKKSYVKRESRKNKGCLPYQGGFVAKSQSASFGKKKADWKAGTLPTELLPHT